ncbi:MAG: hypothetical protein ACLQVI_32665 [Polyangiaceae bacterium]
MSLAPSPSLAPVPDFRYVTLEPGPRARAGMWASFAAAGTTLGAGVLHELGPKGALLAALAAGAGAILLRRVGGPSVAARARAAIGGARALVRRDAVSMAIVPWGILVQPDIAPRVLRWAAVKHVHVDMIHGRDGATPSTLWSVVTIETDHERLAGRAPGAVSIERLIAYVDAYAEEQAQTVALDLEGRRGAEGPFEPVFEPLLSAARAVIVGLGPDSSRLCLPAEGYRRTVDAASPETSAVLRSIIADRVPRSPDPRPIAAVLAAELGAKPLAPDLVTLVQSPHPVLAAVAKAAAQKLGVAGAKVGAVSEVAPFLHELDVDALSAWVERAPT